MTTLSSIQSTCTNSGRIILEPIDVQIPNVLPQKINKLLESVESLHLDIDGSDISDISDPMREYYKDSIYYNRSLIKGLKRPEIHQKIMDGFTDNFKRTSEAVRKEMKIEDWLAVEPKVSKPAVFDNKMQIKKMEALKDAQYMNEDYPEVSEAEASSLSYNYMSGIWRMIEEECKDKEEFFVSPIGYNVFRDTDEYWLEYPSVNLEEVEKAREKCSKWVDRYL